MNEYSPELKFIDLSIQQTRIRKELNAAIEKVLNHGQYIMGPEVEKFENHLKNFTGVSNVVTCANGTDALTLVLMAWGIGPGDAVFIPSFTYIASAETSAQLGATPFFVDVLENTFNIDPKSFEISIKEAVKAGLNPAVVIPVDLFGLPADVKAIKKVANRNNIKILVDAAQSFGATYHGSQVGTLGDATTTSFFPAKPLGCYGDGGAVFTNDDDLAAIVNSIRLHGKGDQKYDNLRVGVNSRLDTLQAAILIEKLKIFPEELELRENVASSYQSKLGSIFKTPQVPKGLKSAWAQYTLIFEDRDNVQKFLKENDIPSVVYYPKALSQQSGYSKFPTVSSGLDISEELSSKVLSLPMYPYLEEDNIDYICNTLKSYYD